MEIEMENGPKLDRGKNGKKMAQKWIFEGVVHYFSISGPFLPFLPLSSLGRFPFRFPFIFPFPAFWTFSMPYQPGIIPKLWQTAKISEENSLRLHRFGVHL